MASRETNIIAAEFTRKAVESASECSRLSPEEKAENAYAARQEALDRLHAALTACEVAEETEEELTEDQRNMLMIEQEQALALVIIANHAYLIAASELNEAHCPGCGKEVRFERERFYFSAAWRALEILGECPPINASADDAAEYVHAPEYLRTLEKWMRAGGPEPVGFIRKHAKAGGFAN